MRGAGAIRRVEILGSPHVGHAFVHGVRTWLAEIPHLHCSRAILLDLCSEIELSNTVPWQSGGTR